MLIFNSVLFSPLHQSCRRLPLPPFVSPLTASSRFFAATFLLINMLQRLFGYSSHPHYKYATHNTLLCLPITSRWCPLECISPTELCHLGHVAFPIARFIVLLLPKHHLGTVTTPLQPTLHFVACNLTDNNIFLHHLFSIWSGPRSASPPGSFSSDPINGRFSIDHLTYAVSKSTTISTIVVDLDPSKATESASLPGLSDSTSSRPAPADLTSQ